MSELDFSDFLHELHLEGPGFSWMSPESIMHKRAVNLLMSCLIWVYMVVG